MKRNAQVYVIATDDSVKVGHSRNPQERLKQIKCDGNIAYVTDVLDEVEKIERTSHRLLTLSGRHVRGEWFAASVKEAIDAIERAKRIVAGEELPLDVVPSSLGEVIHMRISPEHLRKLDDLRKLEPDFPTRSDMVRRLIDRAADRRERKGKKP